MDAPINIWNEIRVTDEGISITLFSESREGGAIVEDEAWFTFDELSAGQSPISLNPSDETKEKLAEKQELIDEAEDDLYQPDVGDVLIDDNPAPWSDDTRVVVEEVTDIPANEYQIEGFRTVADANPSYPEDNRVVKGHYQGSVKNYAFPIDRLVEPETTLSQKEWHDQYGN